MAEKLPILERLETFWESHNQKLNTIIGKLSVPAMQTRNPMVMGMPPRTNRLGELGR